MGFVLSWDKNDLRPLPFLCESHFRHSGVVVCNSVILIYFFWRQQHVFISYLYIHFYYYYYYCAVSV